MPKQPTPKEEVVHKQLCSYLHAQYPDIIFLSDLSGVKLPMGLARKVSSLKSCRGIPDLIILEPRNGHHGLLLELKREGVKLYKKDGSFVNEHIAEQYHLLSRLNKKNYLAGFVMGFQDGKDTIDKYLA